MMRDRISPPSTPRHQPPTASVLALVITLAGGCGTTNPLSSARDLVGDHAGPNTPITAINAEDASRVVFAAAATGIQMIVAENDDEIGGLFGKPARTGSARARGGVAKAGGGSVTAGTALQQARTARADGLVTINIELDPVTLPGANSGSITLIEGHLTMIGDASSDTASADLEIELKFEDYSDNGRTFIGGTAVYRAFGTIGSDDGEALREVVTGYIAAAGAYEGAMSANVAVGYPGIGLQCTGEVTIDGTEVPIDVLAIDVESTVDVGDEATGGLAERQSRFYALTVLSAQRVKLSLETVSGDLDPYVVLAEQNGVVIAWNDDGGDGLNSLLTVQLTAGTYLVMATGFGGSGEYLLATTELAVPTEISVGSSVTGFLAGGEEILHGLTIAVQQLITFDLERTSGDFDPVLGLFDNNGALITSDDDSGVGLNSRIVITLSPGTYIVAAAAWVGGSGDYRLTVTGN